MEFDYLKSVEIEARVSKIRWLTPGSATQRRLLSCNDKTIKLWRVGERCQREYTHVPGSSLLPKIHRRTTNTVARPLRTFANGHAYQINGLSMNSDQETFISSDDLRINLWHTNNKNEAFLVVDLKPANMEELSEVITGAEFHPYNCNLLMYSSSKGLVRVGDLREQALCDRYAKVYEDIEGSEPRSFFSELISSVSDARFSRCGRYVITRDYLTLRIWDLAMEKRPVARIPFHDYLRSHLSHLYETDCIFDKFDFAVSPDSKFIVGGTYHGAFTLVPVAGGQPLSFEAGKPKPSSGGFFGSLSWGRSKKPSAIMKPFHFDPVTADFTNKALRCAWSPNDSTFAVASSNRVLLYSQQSSN
eukprot:TRINITY_DN287_c0_g1_i3.p1 TRINITY_DN287_c0_g1~~TRINITY_DN287_c0_g1_i3.p1  ORF type:complete len:360 (+),score=30.67 TRINITY_DN287_c0_g1_i3:688-1767(+)